MDTTSPAPVVDPGASCAVGPEPVNRQPRLCLWCRAPLKGRQLRFCCGPHRSAYRYSRLSPTAAPVGPRTRVPNRTRILDVFLGGGWYTVAEIAAFLRIHPTTADRKLRDLRRPEFGGYRVVYRRRGGQRVNEFSLGKAA